MVVQEAQANLARGALLLQATVLLLIKLCVGASINADRITTAYASVSSGGSSFFGRVVLQRRSAATPELAGALLSVLLTRLPLCVTCFGTCRGTVYPYCVCDERSSRNLPALGGRATLVPVFF